MAEQQAREELASFLLNRRRQLLPEAVGLRNDGRRRTSGLRREEVSSLSGVSLTWYTWLEQARDIQPSQQVVDALARALRLSTAEHVYLRRLTGYPPSIESSAEAAVTCPPHVQRLLDAFGPSPAFALTPSWGIAGWNRAYSAFYPGVMAAESCRINLLRVVFTDPFVRDMLVDWRSEARRFLAQFRAQAGLRLHEPPLAQLITSLRESSEYFRQCWNDHDIEQFTSRERLFHHPTVGPLRLEQHPLVVWDCPDLDLVVYTAVPGTGTGERLRRLTAG